jgi:hypothetical protein
MTGYAEAHWRRVFFNSLDFNDMLGNIDELAT